jgi:hypothetical protein
MDCCWLGTQASAAACARRQSDYPVLQFALAFGWFRDFLLERASGACSFRWTLPSEALSPTGMAEAFVKTFNGLCPCPRPADAKTVMAELSQWFEDYNEFHPHKGLKMKSPRQFIRSQFTNRILSGLIGATPLPFLEGDYV